MKKTTSLERFLTAWDALDPSIQKNIHTLRLTVLDNDPSVHFRYRRKVAVEAALYVALQEEGRIKRSFHALFDPATGKYLGGRKRYDMPFAVEEVVRWSEQTPSQPFGIANTPLTEILEGLGEYTPEKLAVKAAAAAKYERRRDEEDRQRKEKLHQADLARMIQARAEAARVLGDDATNAVLDYFLPLPVLEATT
jgi:hypothetical protein